MKWGFNIRGSIDIPRMVLPVLIVNLLFGLCNQACAEPKSRVSQPVDRTKDKNRRAADAVSDQMAKLLHHLRVASQTDNYVVRPSDQYWRERRFPIESDGSINEEALDTVEKLYFKASHGERQNFEYKNGYSLTKPMYEERVVVTPPKGSLSKPEYTDGGGYNPFIPGRIDYIDVQVPNLASGLTRFKPIDHDRIEDLAVAQTKLKNIAELPKPPPIGQWTSKAKKEALEIAKSQIAFQIFQRFEMSGSTNYNDLKKLMYEPPEYTLGQVNPHFWRIWQSVVPKELLLAPFEGLQNQLPPDIVTEPYAKGAYQKLSELSEPLFMEVMLDAVTYPHEALWVSKKDFLDNKLRPIHTLKRLIQEKKMGLASELAEYFPSSPLYNNSEYRWSSDEAKMSFFEILASQSKVKFPVWALKHFVKGIFEEQEKAEDSRNAHDIRYGGQRRDELLERCAALFEKHSDLKMSRELLVHFVGLATGAAVVGIRSAPGFTLEGAGPWRRTTAKLQEFVSGERAGGAVSKKARSDFDDFLREHGEEYDGFMSGYKKSKCVEAVRILGRF